MLARNSVNNFLIWLGNFSFGWLVPQCNNKLGFRTKFRFACHLMQTKIFNRSGCRCFRLDVRLAAEEFQMIIRQWYSFLCYKITHWLATKSQSVYNCADRFFAVVYTNPTPS